MKSTDLPKGILFLKVAQTASGEKVKFENALSFDHD